MRPLPAPAVIHLVATRVYGVGICQSMRNSLRVGDRLYHRCFIQACTEYSLPGDRLPDNHTLSASRYVYATIAVCSLYCAWTLPLTFDEEKRETWVFLTTIFIRDQ